MQPKHSLFSFSPHCVSVCECVVARSFSIAHSLTHSRQLPKIAIFMISSASPQPPSPTGERDEERERERALAQWSLLRWVLFYCSFKPSLIERNGNETHIKQTTN